MKEIFKTLLKFIFANTKLDEKLSDTLETAKEEITRIDKKFDDFKSDLEKIPAEKAEVSTEEQSSESVEIEASQEVSETTEQNV
jgi:uncharacterized protein (DUF3084 family)